MSGAYKVCCHHVLDNKVHKEQWSAISSSYPFRVTLNRYGLTQAWAGTGTLGAINNGALGAIKLRTMVPIS